MKGRIQDLLKQFKTGELSNTEKLELLELVKQDGNSVSDELVSMIMEEESQKHFEANEVKWDNILTNVLVSDKPRRGKMKIVRTVLKWVSAAVILIAISFTLYEYLNKSVPKEIVFTQDVKPGNDKATLTLANGKQILLSDAQKGDIAKEAGLVITKTEEGQLIYKVLAKDDKNESAKVNTITTPKGGQWQVLLPDGSKVWLNAASSLTYPISFATAKNRRVELNGEAYFEVAKDKTRPFIVKTAKQEVEVLGTHFNINSYEDEQVTKTTLLEGSVRVSHNNTQEVEVLKPGEQATLSDKGIDVAKTDVRESVAWKDGYFMFNNEKQDVVMRKLCRWYNVEVEYADASAKDVMYYGTVSRFGQLSQVLRKLAQTGDVNFDIKNNKIIVFKGK